MITLSYGFLKPQTGDKGSTWFPAMETNIQKLNDHTHNGTDSAAIPRTSLSAVVQTVSSAGWVSTGGGNFSMSVTVPLGINLDKQTPIIFDSTGKLLGLSLQKTTTTSFDLQTNDSTLNLSIYYV